MKIFKIIDYLLIGTRYGSWGLGLSGIILSILLGIVNVANGIGAVFLCVAMLLLAISISLILGPHNIYEHWIGDKKRYGMVSVCLLSAVLLAGLVTWTNGGFPPLNLLFI